VPTIVARLEVDGQELTVIGTHPPPPRGQKGSVYRNQQLAALARYVNSINGPLLLCGDFNISPWSPYFRQLLRDSGLLDSERGFGLHPTWPVDRPLLRVPIDHCLISPQIQVTSRRVGPYTGSDHFPVIIDFLL
jgi:endonuclease/exonuclease/phosphatase (EEP) superfamily protein YafD